MADAIEIPSTDRTPKLALTVTNRGAEPTTITHMICFGYESRWKRMRAKACFTAVVNETHIPYQLGPNSYWIGQMRYADEATTLRAQGRLYVGVISAHRRKPFLIHVPANRTA